MSNEWQNVRDFGAVGDGETDDTDAICRAIEAAGGEHGGTVYFPAGAFCSGQIEVPDHVTLVGDAGWSYREAGNSVLRLNDPDAECLVDLSCALAPRISGLTLDGSGLGEEAVGILHDKTLDEREDPPAGCHLPVIERSCVMNFSGDGLLFSVGVSAIRQCGIARNGGHGINYRRGADCFISDNIIWANGGAGVWACGGSGNTTLTGNRIEHNDLGGLVAQNAWHYSITGNAFDHNKNAPSIWLRDNCHDFTITGNSILRGGVFMDGEVPEEDPYLSANVRAENCGGLVLSGNGLQAEPVGGPANRTPGDPVFPRYGVVVRGLNVASITGNHLAEGATEELIVDLGGHDDPEQVIIGLNPGTLA
jgi:hypothetical protein